MNAFTKDHRHPRIPRRLSPPRISNWLLAIAMAAVLLALGSWFNLREDRERAAAAVQPRAKLQIDIDALCPPETPGTTSIVVFTINTAADHGPAIEGCSRIAQRKYPVPGRVITSSTKETR